MKLLSVILAVISLMSAAEACKCWNLVGRPVSEYTQACCMYTSGGGVFNRTTGNCDGDLFDKLDAFAQCCENFAAFSDCSCPECD